MVRIISFCPWWLLLIAFVFLSGNLGTYAIALIIALIHELGHMIIALACGYGVGGIKIQPFGVGLMLKDSSVSCKHEILIAIAGPVVNVLLIIAGVFFLKAKNDFSSVFFVTNIYMLCINLLPVLPLDGGRVLSATLRMEFDETQSGKIVRVVSVVCVAIIMALGVVCFFRSESNISLFIVALFLLDNIRQNSDKSHNITNVFFSKQTCVSAKTFCVEEDMIVRDLLKALPFENVEVIIVTDSYGKVINTFTNKYILNLLTDGYGNLKLSDACMIDASFVLEEV